MWVPCGALQGSNAQICGTLGYQAESQRCLGHNKRRNSYLGPRRFDTFNNQFHAAKFYPFYCLCCECGVAIPPNPAAMCANCIRSRVDITEGIPKQAIIHFCRGCGRYLSPPTAWIVANLESRELLGLCLKRLKGLNKVRLIDAGFVWTEPHSRRIKVKLTIQKEVLSGAILQQVFVVEYTVAHQFCLECHRQEAKDTWNAVVQVRQKTAHKKTFFHLEQLMIKHNAHTKTIKISSKPDGLDFFFTTKADAKRLVDFLLSVVPARVKLSEKLISQDIQSGTYNYKFTFFVEIVPICREDVVCLPPSLVRHFGGISPICVCTRVGSSMQLVDPISLRTVEVSSTLYWRNPFNSLCTHGGFQDYVVIDIEPLLDQSGQQIEQGKFVLAEAAIARERDFGVNDQQFVVRTHLGRKLYPGDTAVGFDLGSANINDDNAAKLNPADFPDVILVKKSYVEARRNRRRNRKWKLLTLPKEEGELRRDQEDTLAKDFEAFMEDLEEDPEYRGNFKLFKDPEFDPAAASEASDVDDPLRIQVDELLDEFDDMALADETAGPDVEDADGHDGEGMAVDNEEEEGASGDQ